MIPKIVHYCWLGDDAYPDLVKNCIQSWKQKLPDWELKLWDKKCLKELDSSWVLEAYEAKKYAFAADYIRLYAVYTYGGFYLDSDVEVLKDFAPLLKYPYVFCAENSEGDIEAATFLGEITNVLAGKYGIVHIGSNFSAQNWHDLKRLYISIVSHINDKLAPSAEDIVTLLQYDIGRIGLLRSQVPHSVLDRTLYNMLEYLAENIHLDFHTAIIGLAERAVTAPMMVEQYLQSFGNTILPLLYDSYRDWQRGNISRGPVQEIPYERLDEESKKALIFDILVASGLLKRSDD